MSTRRADARFLLPYPPRRATVLPTAAGWRPALEAAGIAVDDPPSDGGPGLEGGDGDGHLAVAGVVDALAAIATGADLVVVEGHGAGRRLRDHGFHVRRYLPLPAPDRLDLVLPLDQPLPTRYAIERWAIPDRRWKQVRNRVVGVLAHQRRLPEIRPTVAIGTRRTGAPFIVDAARPLGLPEHVEWFMALGEGDELQRGVLVLFPKGERDPRWALKFARVRDYDAPFVRDEHGLGLVARAGGSVATSAPRLLGRTTCEGLHLSLETAAVGDRLTNVLKSPRSRAAKLAVVDRIASWVVDLGARTKRSPAELGAERARLADQVVPPWLSSGAPPDLVASMPQVPAVVAHNDLGAWNILVDGTRFTAVDWESARADCLPLWDLLYFLTDALAQVDGVSGKDARLDHAVRLHTGALPSSAVLFRWVRDGAAALDVPAEAVGTLAALCWLHHGLSHVARTDAVRRYAPPVAAAVEKQSNGDAGVAVPERVPLWVERMASTWLEDPRLGLGWDRWR